ncbi:SPOR domain-containing protein [Neobacillus sp. NPDC058068]|uniref:SPOR domain-containing protein n=1 Tax=Neobacillus sp. NPDC058068 TaxID=3346325 RepID=UPI0036DA44F2
MDKPKKGHTINIKLSGQDKTFREEPQKKEPEVSSEPFTKVIKINTERLEPEEQNEPETRVIKINRDLGESDGFLETAAAQEPVDESFDWIIPESSENDIEEFNVASHPKTIKSGSKKLTSFSSNFKKNDRQPVGSIVISAIFAILIGLTIGGIMLKLVIMDPSEKAATEPPKAVEANGSDNKAAAGKTTSLTINQLTTFVIQGGYYTSKAGAKEVSEQLVSKGIPSQVIEITGKHFIFLGVADSIEQAKTLAGQNKENGVDGAFAKPLLLEEKKFSEITPKEKSFLEAVPGIYQTLSAAAANALASKEISEESSKALATLEEELKGSTIKSEKVKSLQAELANAEAKLKAFQKSKDTKSLTEAQQHLLNFLSFYFSV